MFKKALRLFLAFGAFPIFWLLYLDEPSIWWLLLKAVGYGTLCTIGAFVIIAFMTWLEED